VDGAMVGIIMGQLNEAQNVGYMIPNVEIQGYLNDVEDGRYDGKYNVDDHFQTLENEALRAKLGINRSVRGMMVRKPARTDPSYPLREGDVLTRLGDVPIDNEGMVPYEEGLRLSFTSLVSRLARDGKLPVEFVRKGEAIRAEVPVTRERPSLFRTFRGEQPAYFVHGPLVFSPVYQEASAFYFRLNPLAAVDSPMIKRSGDDPAFPGEELVVVTAPMMSHRVAKGYGDPFGFVVADVDGVPVKNLGHLVELFRDGKEEFVTLRFHNALSETMVFRRDALEEATAEVMNDNGIARRGSEDAMSHWRTGPVGTR
ncbi:MAG: serine protease, partial [Isosphaeraceae bacterium]